jgi:hypothetical protein
MSHFWADVAEPWHSMAKHMYHYGVTFAKIPTGILELSEEIECHNREPLYILPSSDEKAQHLLYEVSRY